MYGKSRFEKKIANQFQTYLLPTFIIYIFFQMLYSTYHKPNEGIYFFKMKDKKLSNLLSCVL
jgi:hypothetical protein